MAVLFLFGKTVPPKKQEPRPSAVATQTETFDFESSLSEAKAKLNPTQQGYVNGLENAVVRGDVKNQQIHTYHQLSKNNWAAKVRLFSEFSNLDASAV